MSNWLTLLLNNKTIFSLLLFNKPKEFSPNSYFNKHRIIAFLIVIFGCFISCTQSQELLDNDYILIRPDKCVLEEEQEFCEEWFVITVSLEEQANYCLFLDNSNSPLFCFEDNQVEIKKQLRINQDTTIKLQDMASGIYLANAKIQLMTYIPVQKRKRRHLAWGVF